MFEYHNNILCVQSAWLYGDGEVMTYDNYKKMSARSLFKTLVRGCRNTHALVEYDSLPQRFKSKIEQLVGDPHKTTKNTTFKDYLITDLKAIEYYANYTLNNGSALPENRQKEYVANAIVLNAIHQIATNTTAKRRALGGTTTKIWKQLTEIVQSLPKHSYPHSLPNNHRKLQQKLQAFKQIGYEALIHKGYCNTNSEKINDAAKLWLLSRWANNMVKVANVTQLLGEYNVKAKSTKGMVDEWKELKHEKTIYNYLYHESVKYLWWGNRYGDASAKEKFTLQHSTILPTMRDSLWYSDGTKLNFFYLNEDGKIETCQVYEVMDSYSEVFLGYHISKTEDYEAQYFAYKMAAKVSGFKPYEVKFDGQGGHKKLQTGNFLSKLAHLAIKTAPYNGRSKTIEAAFGRFQQQLMSTTWFFTGQNITAKAQESKTNREFILANKTNLPTKKEAIAAYIKLREQWNAGIHPKTGIPRIEMYRNSTNPQTKELTIWEMVDMFWILREKPVTVTGNGISFTEKKIKYTYLVTDKEDMPDVNWLRNNIDKKLYIKFDPEDMSLIYLYEKDALGLRRVGAATTKVEIHRGKQEQEDWEASYIDEVKQRNEQERLKSFNKMNQILEDHNALPEQHGFNSPGLLGINNKKKKPNNIGEVMKRESNVVYLEEEVEEVQYYNKL